MLRAPFRVSSLHRIRNRCNKVQTEVRAGNRGALYVTRAIHAASIYFRAMRDGLLIRAALHRAGTDSSARI